MSHSSVTRFQLVKPRDETFRAPSNRAVWLLPFQHSVFPLGGPAASPLACLHPFLPRNLSLEMGEGPWKRHCARPSPTEISQPFYTQAVGSVAAIFADLSAFSLPATPICAGRHQIAMIMPGLALHSVAMCFLAWIAYCWPGPGSSEPTRLMASWAPEEIVIRSGTVCLREADSNALVGAAHSAF